MAIADIVNAITVTAELTGAEMSGAAIAVMAQDLTAQHSEAEIIGALTRCRRELSRPLTAGAVFERMEQSDGRPSADEAWAMALDARDERLTVVWTSEACEAFWIARPVLEAGDKVGARMAFRDAYERIVRNNRGEGNRVSWNASLGWDNCQREISLRSAELRGLLSPDHVAALLPAPTGGFIANHLFGNAKALPSPEISEDDAERARRWCKKLRLQMAGKA